MYRCVLSLNFFWFIQRVHSLPSEAWIFVQCTQKRVSVDGLPDGQIFPFFLKTIFHWVE